MARRPAHSKRGFSDLLASLAWYADSINWHTVAAKKDRGMRARKALARLFGVEYDALWPTRKMRR